MRLDKKNPTKSSGSGLELVAQSLERELDRVEVIAKATHGQPQAVIELCERSGERSGEVVVSLLLAVRVLVRGAIARALAVVEEVVARAIAADLVEVRPSGGLPKELELHRRDASRRELGLVRLVGDTEHRALMSLVHHDGTQLHLVDLVREMRDLGQELDELERLLSDRCRNRDIHHVDLPWRSHKSRIDRLCQSSYPTFMIPSTIKIKNGELPDVPGVYLMKDHAGKVIYVGKATSLKRRVSSYFLASRHGDGRAHIEEMMPHVYAIDYITKPTAIEALILEANLIKYYWPPYNVMQKDNKSFLYLVITNEDFPKPLLIRGTELDEESSKKYKAVFGPYTSPRSLRAALDLLRKVFPWSTCEPGRPRACFYVHLKQCPGVCVNLIEKKAYAKIIRDLIKFFEGKKDDLLKQYQREMKAASKKQEYELAADLRNKITFLEHIRDIAILKREDVDVDKIRMGEAAVNLYGRIEGYDISHVSGTSTVASMVVFEDGAPAKQEYRKFRIKTVVGSNDVASMKETLMRRFRNNWRHPDLILIDGGLPQVNAAEQVIHELDLGLPIIGIAKGPERKRNDLICSKNNLELCKLCEQHQELLEKVRDEAHRFAITYHRKLRGRTMRGSDLPTIQIEKT